MTTTTTILTVADLVRELLKQDQNAPVRLSVGWAGDSAQADEGDILVRGGGGEVYVSGWMSNCTTSLEK